MFTTNPSFGIKSYNFEDKGFKDITDGMYQYEIEVEITDPLIDFLAEKLETTMKKFPNSLNIIILPLLTRHTTIPNKKRFASKFGVDIVRGKYGNNPQEYAWVTAPAKYIDTLTEFAPESAIQRKTCFWRVIQHYFTRYW